MRRSSIAALVAFFAFACSEAPSAPLLEPGGASFQVSEIPPPWAMVEGNGTAENVPFSWSAHFLANPGNTLAWLQFKSGTNITFSSNARIMKQGTKVSGFGTAKVTNGPTIDLRTVTTFQYESWRTTGRLYFEGPNFSGGERGEISIGDGPGACTGCLDTKPKGPIR